MTKSGSADFAKLEVKDIITGEIREAREDTRAIPGADVTDLSRGINAQVTVKRDGKIMNLVARLDSLQRMPITVSIWMADLIASLRLLLRTCSRQHVRWVFCRTATCRLDTST